jgi:hypothetical protein
MTSTLSATSSFASDESLPALPPAERNSNKIFCPSMYPKSRSPSRMPFVNGAGSGSPSTRIPMRGVVPDRATLGPGQFAIALPSSSRNSRRLTFVPPTPEDGIVPVKPSILEAPKWTICGGYIFTAELPAGRAEVLFCSGSGDAVGKHLTLLRPQFPRSRRPDPPTVSTTAA